MQNEFKQYGTVQLKKRCRLTLDQENRISKGVTRVKARRCLYALVWKNRWEVYVLTNMDPPLAEGNLCYDINCPLKPHIVVGISGTLGVLAFLIMWPTAIHWVDIVSGVPQNCFSSFEHYSAARLCYLCAILNYPLGFQTCSGDEFIEEAGKSQDRSTPSLSERLSGAATNVTRFDSHHNQHWLAKPANPAASFTQLMVRERVLFIGALHVKPHCVWCLVSQDTSQK
jgi:hypothetical protein